MLRWDFLTRNYIFALNYLLLHGRGIWNTVLYCGGAVLIAIIINPMCAYALSRFRLPYAQSVLMFLLATMAFPAEVAMIPNFLLLKQLGLLNTFWALILPSAASGFSIFLLKGFFDSLPQELYEAGMIDGAGEMTLFTRVTLPLARPIFAVIGLQAFAAAYGAFLFAMIVCQAQDHWTLMVWIYEFQALQAPEYVMMAALVIAALPTLLVFMAAQGVIMRGIILPSFK
jgi:multiple sugar transport system permease protein